MTGADPTWRPGDELRSGASNEDDETYGLHPTAAAKLAEEILAAPEEEHAQRKVDLDRAHGRDTAPHRNRHLDGYGDTRRSG